MVQREKEILNIDPHDDISTALDFSFKYEN